MKGLSCLPPSAVTMASVLGGSLTQGRRWAQGKSRRQDRRVPQLFESLESQTKHILLLSAHRPSSLDPRLLGLSWYMWVERGSYWRTVDNPSFVVKNVWLQIPALLFTRRETFGKHLVFLSLSFFISKMKILLELL